MNSRIRVSFDVPDDIRRALNLRAAGEVRTVGEIIDELVRSAMPEYVTQAQAYISAGAKPPKRRTGPKPKKAD